MVLISVLTLFLVEVKDKKESIVATYFTKMTKMIPWRVFMSFYWMQDQEEILPILRTENVRVPIQGCLLKNSGIGWIKVV